MERGEGGVVSVVAQTEREPSGKRKLIRNKIPRNVKKKKGIILNTRRAESDEEYSLLLDEKLEEEITEWMENHKPEELADVLEVIRAQCDFRSKFSFGSVSALVKADKRFTAAVKGSISDMDVFNGMFLTQIGQWAISHRPRDLANILEMTYTACDISHITVGEVERQRQLKHAQKGGFSQRVVLEPQEAV
ncbi:MAG: hypothetical protein M1444_04185 [Patescibacteria group bacterium]|nr:hypothetical protein [Patescibacteria group bacterium]